MSDLCRRAVNRKTKKIEITNHQKYFFEAKLKKQKHHTSQMSTINISTFLVSDYTFERMQSYGDYTEFGTFDEFKTHNLQCIADLDEEDRVWVTGLCKRISKRTLCMMDEEYASSHDVWNFYFDKKKNIHVVCPR